MKSTAYWEQRYEAHDMPWEKGAPSPGLVDFLAAHPKAKRGTVAVPGGGTGNDAREFDRVGFETFGFDIAPSAIRLSKARTKAAGLKAKFELRDFLREEPPQKFDWVFEHTLFCAIEPEERDLYVEAVLRWLKPRGYFLAVHYMIPNTEGPPYGVKRAELWRRFSPHFELREEYVPRSYPNRTGLELLMWWQRKAVRRKSPATKKAVKSRA